MAQQVFGMFDVATPEAREAMIIAFLDQLGSGRWQERLQGLPVGQMVRLFDWGFPHVGMAVARAGYDLAGHLALSLYYWRQSEEENPTGGHPLHSLDVGTGGTMIMIENVPADGSASAVSAFVTAWAITAAFIMTDRVSNLEGVTADFLAGRRTFADLRGVLKPRCSGADRCWRK